MQQLLDLFLEKGILDDYGLINSFFHKISHVKNSHVEFSTQLCATFMLDKNHRDVYTIKYCVNTEREWIEFTFQKFINDPATSVMTFVIDDENTLLMAIDKMLQNIISASELVYDYSYTDTGAKTFNKLKKTRKVDNLIRDFFIACELIQSVKRELIEYQVEWSETNDRVWIHASDGSTVGRFSKTGIDLHHSVTEQLNGKPQCRLCTHDFATLEDWKTFQKKAKEFWGVDVPDEAFNPEHLLKK